MQRVLAVTALLALAVDGQSLAQEPILTDEVLVSGGRTPIAADAYGRANSVVTAEEIERRQITEVAEALRALPGVSVSRAGGPGGLTEVRLRGAESNHVLVLIDGVEVSTAQDGAYDFAGLLTADIERIEVLRGPQSSLYGSNATAGVISIITKRGQRDSFAAGGRIEGGSDATRYFDGYLRGGGEDFDISFSAAFRRDGGFDVSDSPGGKDDEDRNVTVNAKANFTVLDELTIGGTFRVTDRESDFDQFNFGAATSDGLVTDADNFTQQREIFGSAYATLDTLGGRMQSTLRFDYADVATTTFINAVPSADVESDRMKLSLQTTFAVDAATVDLADHTITLLTEWERESFANVNPALVFNPSQLERQERALYGFAGEYRGSFFDALDVQFGLRYDVNDDFDDALTYSIGMSYTVAATGTRFHGSVGTGVTNPTFFEQFGFIPATFVGNPSLQPEENFGWDIGVEQTLWNGLVILDITYFNDRLKDEIITTFPPPLFLSTAVNQTGTSKRQGVEVTLSAQPVDGLDVGLGYTYLDADDPDGSIEVRRPRHEGGLTVAYTFLGGDATVSADARLVIGNFDTDFTAASFGNARVRLDDYVLVDVAGSYKVHEMVDLTLRVENLTDAEYQEQDGFAAQGIAGFGGVRLTF